MAHAGREDGNFWLGAGFHHTDVMCWPRYQEFMQMYLVYAPCFPNAMLQNHGQPLIVHLEMMSRNPPGPPYI